jgi:FtsP/CotA-like multicopper oxidase with cupredoxin domain
MGERYDVVVTAADGVFPLVAVAEGKNALARALLSTGAGTAPDPAFQPPELSRRVGIVDMFTATPDAALASTKTDTNLSAQLSGGMMNYDSTINGRPFADTEPITIRQGQRATLTFTNMSMMWHPMHLHGHTFQVIRPDGALAPQRHRRGASHAQTGRRSCRRQSRRLDAALPQHLPPRSRNADQPLNYTT